MTLPLEHTQLENNVTLRPPTLADVPAAADLLNLIGRGLLGRDVTSEEALRHDWCAPGFDLAGAARGAFDDQGTMIGLVSILDTSSMPVRPHMALYVHPDYQDSSIGSRLIVWGEQRARQVEERLPAHARIVLEAAPLSTDHFQRALLAAHNIVNSGQSWCKMAIHLQAPPAAPVWPEGIRPATAADVNDMRAIFEVTNTAFRDHRNYVEEDPETAFTRWLKRKQSDPRFNPALWLLAMAGDRIIGTSLCRDQSWDHPERANIATLCVLREYRRQGIARALLLYSFHILWQQGIRDIELWVDGSSITGAADLYLSAGMYIDQEYTTHIKELRPGQELSQQG